MNELASSVSAAPKVEAANTTTAVGSCVWRRTTVGEGGATGTRVPISSRGRLVGVGAGAGVVTGVGGDWGAGGAAQATIAAAVRAASRNAARRSIILLAYTPPQPEGLRHLSDRCGCRIL